MEDLRRALGGMTLGGQGTAQARTPRLPTTTNTPRGTQLFAAYAPPQAPVAPAPYVPPPARGQMLYRPAHERLIDLQRTALPHHPDTPAGQLAYGRQVADYLASNGGGKPSETRPYPLRPGTLAVSTGCCFKCGMDTPRRHTTRDCFTANPVPEFELRYRMIAAVCHSLVCGPQAPGVVAAQPVRMIDVSSFSDAQLAELQADGAIITEYDQGNEK